MRTSEPFVSNKISVWRGVFFFLVEGETIHNIKKLTNDDRASTTTARPPIQASHLLLTGWPVSFWVVCIRRSGDVNGNPYTPSPLYSPLPLILCAAPDYLNTFKQVEYSLKTILRLLPSDFLSYSYCRRCMSVVLMNQRVRLEDARAILSETKGLIVKLSAVYFISSMRAICRLQKLKEKESYYAVPSCGTVFYGVQSVSAFCVGGWNSEVWPFVKAI